MWHAVGLVLALVVAGGHLGQTIWWRHLDPRPPADSGIANLEAWREVCDWAAAETEPEAIFLTPRLAQTFRWYAGRAEVVNRKDIPQDAEGIVEWWRRNRRIYGSAAESPTMWHESLAELGPQRLRQLGAEFGADYVITSAYPALNLERVGPINASFAIYRLPGKQIPSGPAAMRRAERPPSDAMALTNSRSGLAIMRHGVSRPRRGATL